jgi:hypothetical protein
VTKCRARFIPHSSRLSWKGTGFDKDHLMRTTSQLSGDGKSCWTSPDDADIRL